jgi:hypothetical protein
MKVLFDTNGFLDLFLKRDLFFGGHRFSGVN